MKEQLQNIQSQVEKIKADFSKLILEMPDNPNITRLSNSPNCYVISSSELFKSYVEKDEEGKTKKIHSSNWSPFYHDFKSQYKFLSDLINKTKSESIINVLEKIIETGQYQERVYSYGPTHNCKFHPEVIAQLKTML